MIEQRYILNLSDGASWGFCAAPEIHGWLDVVVYPHPEQGREVVHRVIEVTPDGVRTRGDNNNKIDPYLVFPEDIRGRVVTVRRASRSRKVCRGYPGLLLMRGNRAIGRLAPGADAWVIRFPYRLFIDRGELPR